MKPGVYKLHSDIGNIGIVLITNTTHKISDDEEHRFVRFNTHTEDHRSWFCYTDSNVESYYNCNQLTYIMSLDELYQSLTRGGE